MVNARVYTKKLVNYTWRIGRIKGHTEANLVHDCDSGILALLVQLHHCGGNVAGRDNVLLFANSRLDDIDMIDVWNQADDQVMLGNFGVQSIVVQDIDRGRCGKFVVTRKFSSGLQSSTSCINQRKGQLISTRAFASTRVLFIVHVRHKNGDMAAAGKFVPTVTGMPALVKTSSVGSN